jgi:hypothetical protein
VPLNPELQFTLQASVRHADLIADAQIRWKS